MVRQQPFFVAGLASSFKLGCNFTHCHLAHSLSQVACCTGAAERRPAKRSPLIPLSQAAAASAASAANSRSVVRRPAPKRRFSLASENIPPVPLFVGSSVPPKRALPACPVSPSSWGVSALSTKRD